MTAPPDVAGLRLRAQRLVGEPMNSPVDVVRSMGAVQAQDYPGATWALGIRSRSATRADIDDLFDQGAILRTHVLRPTWHFVLPEDIRWIQELTGPRIFSGLKARHRDLELDAKTVVRAEHVLAKALEGGHHLNRSEVGRALTRARISPAGARLSHFCLCAELHGVIVSGPRRDGQMTWAMLEERVTASRRLDREAAIVELAGRYFRSHGPAQVMDFAWWSGLNARDTRIGIAQANLERWTVDGVEYWFDSANGAPPSRKPKAHLLPNFDEYLVAFRDRTAAIDSSRRFDASRLAMGSVLANVVLLNGKVRGGWAKTQKRRSLVVELRLFEPPSPAERTAFEAAVADFSRFLGRPVEALIRT